MKSGALLLAAILLFTAEINCMTSKVIRLSFPRPGDKTLFNGKLDSIGLNARGDIVFDLSTENGERRDTFCIPARLLDSLTPDPLIRYVIRFKVDGCVTNLAPTQKLLAVRKKKLLLLKDLKLAIVGDFSHMPRYRGASLKNKLGAIKKVLKAPDNSLYIIDEHNKILRLVADQIDAKRLSEFRYKVKLKNGRILNHVTYSVVEDSLLIFKRSGVNEVIPKSQVLSVERIRVLAALPKDMDTYNNILTISEHIDLKDVLYVEGGKQVLIVDWRGRKKYYNKKDIVRAEKISTGAAGKPRYDVTIKIYYTVKYVAYEIRGDKLLVFYETGLGGKYRLDRLERIHTITREEFKNYHKPAGGRAKKKTAWRIPLRQGNQAEGGTKISYRISTEQISGIPREAVATGFYSLDQATRVILTLPGSASRIYTVFMRRKRPAGGTYHFTLDFGEYKPPVKPLYLCLIPLTLPVDTVASSLAVIYAEKTGTDPFDFLE